MISVKNKPIKWNQKHIEPKDMLQITTRPLISVLDHTLQAKKVEDQEYEKRKTNSNEICDSISCFDSILTTEIEDQEYEIGKADSNERAASRSCFDSMFTTEAEDQEYEKGKTDSNERDSELAKVEAEKTLALIKAWGECEKNKAENKAHKKNSAIGAWESRRRASIEAEWKQVEEEFDKKKAEYAEKMKKKIPETYKEAEEKWKMVEAERREDILKIEKKAAKFRATGIVPNSFPKNLFRCFRF